ncbi:MAG TPA: sulfotransferase [Terriglobales bacterium]|nr:sulfotransferase [Terriglobales bacterium]
MPSDSLSGPLFVVGMWRSGTSLLYTLLNQHPQIALMYEGDLALLRPLFRHGESSPDWLERWEFWNSGITRHSLQRENLPATFPDFRSAAETVWSQYAGLAIYGDKSPNYFDLLPQLARDFPNARFIVIWRDLANICRSMVNARESSSYFRKRGIMHRAVLGYHKLKQGCDTLRSLGIPLHQIQYEEMIDSPAEVMGGICAFLDIRFDPRMTVLDGADRSAIYDASHHAAVNSSNIGLKRARKEVLSPALKSKIGRYLAYWTKEYGGTWPLYPKSLITDVRGPGFLERTKDEALFRALRSFDRFTSRVYCYAPIWMLRAYRSVKARTRGSLQTGNEPQARRGLSKTAAPEISSTLQS